MFEDSTFESYGRIHTRSRAWMIATCAFNGSILLAMVLVPLFYPAVLPQAFRSFLLEVPSMQPPEPKPITQVAMTSTTPTQMQNGHIFAPTQFPPHPYVPPTQEVTRPFNIATDVLGDTSDSGVFPSSERRAEVRQASSGPIRVSSMVAAGWLIHKVTPVYPPIPRASGMEGTVVLQATISRSGTIENLRVISGPAMFRNAAIDAVQQWQYRPYLLNGEPVEVETTINVIFKLN
jgi:protein TonB